MICAACNKAVHAKYTFALGKAWHTYHFTCFACKMVLKAHDDYLETAKGITCRDCAKAKNLGGSGENGSVSGSSPRAGNYELMSVGTQSASPSSTSSSSETLGELDPREMDSSTSLFSVEDRSTEASNSTSSLENWINKGKHPPNSDVQPDSQSDTFSQSDMHSDAHSFDAHSDAESDAQSDALSDILSDTQSDSGDTRFYGTKHNISTPNLKIANIEQNDANTDDTGGAFSSEFYKRSYFYRKTLSLDSVNPPEPTKLIAKEHDRTPNPSPTATTTSSNPKGLSKYGKIRFYHPVNHYSDSNSLADGESGAKQFSDAFYKRKSNPHKNKKFDFEYRDKDSPAPSTTESAQSQLANSAQNEADQSNLFKLIDDQAFISATLLDTSEDMKARSRGPRKPPPSMSIRSVVPLPYVKKPDPPPAPSPSPPLSLPSLPSSPSPPPTLTSNKKSPPSSPQLPRKPRQQSPYTSPAYLQAPPVLTPLSRSVSPPLSLPAIPNKVINDSSNTLQQIRARIEEAIIRSVLDNVNLGSTSDIEKSSITSNATSTRIDGVSSGSSSSSLMARKRKLKKTHKEATMQRQLSLRKHLVLEVVAANGGAKLRKVTPSTGSKSIRQELLNMIRAFPNCCLRKVKTIETESAHALLMRTIRAFPKSDKRLRQVVGSTTASQLLPTMTNLVWKGKNCFGITVRDIQFLLRDPFASKDISTRLALRYRGGASSEGAAQIGEIDCIVAIPHEAAVSFASRLSISLRVPLQILQQRPCRTKNTKSQPVSFPGGRGLYAAGVETMQSRVGEEYELWLTQRNCIRPHARAVVIDDALDNGSPLIAAMLVLRAAGAQVIEVVAILEYLGFGGRDRISQTCQKIGLCPPPNVHACLVFNDNSNVKSHL